MSQMSKGEWTLVVDDDGGDFELHHVEHAFGPVRVFATDHSKSAEQLRDLLEAYLTLRKKPSHTDYGAVRAGRE
jgi:hypothetical protein